MLETLILSVLNADSAIATAAARMVSAADGRPLAEMGSRRTQERAAVSASRAAYIAGFARDLEPRGGAALGRADDGHRRARVHAAARLRGGRVPRADRRDGRGHDAARRHLRHRRRRSRPRCGSRATELGAVRIDSGDLPVVVAEVRRAARRARRDGHPDHRHERPRRVRDRARSRASPVDSYGVGTSVVAGSGHPAAGLRLQARRARRRERRAGARSRRSRARRPAPAAASGRSATSTRTAAPTAERVVVADASRIAGTGRPLTVPLVVDGRAGPGAPRRRRRAGGARAPRRASSAELPLEAHAPLGAATRRSRR